MNVLSLSLTICPSVGSSPSPVSPVGGGGGGERQRERERGRERERERERGRGRERERERERGGREEKRITTNHERQCVSVFVVGDMNDMACSHESMNGEEVLEHNDM